MRPAHSPGRPQAARRRDPDSPGRSDSAADAQTEAELRHLESVATWLDSRFRIPGTGFRFGFDSLLGLVPGVGDTATAIPAAYLVMRAHRMGAPAHLVARMVLNVLIDLFVGAIPLLGDLFDLGFKANRRNVNLLRGYFGSAGSRN